VNHSRAELLDSWKLVAKDASRVIEVIGTAGGAAVLAGILILILAVQEVRSSWIEARLLPAVDHRLNFWLSSGPTSDLQPQPAGPYDQRLGFSNLPEFIGRLEKNQYEVAAQASLVPQPYFPAGAIRTTSHI